MQLHCNAKHQAHAPLHLDPATAQAAEVAIARAQRALDGGKLLSPGEALAIACGGARGKETLYSIARSVAFETDTNVDALEGILNEKFPSLAH